MNYLDCFRALACRRTRDRGDIGGQFHQPGGRRRATARRAYLDASMSLSICSPPGWRWRNRSSRSGLSRATAPLYESGMLMVEREMNFAEPPQPGFDGPTAAPQRRAAQFADNDYGAMARSMGLSRVFEFRRVDEIGAAFPSLDGIASAPLSLCSSGAVLGGGAEARTAAVRRAGIEISLRPYVGGRFNCSVFGYRLK
jgi:hypothetical protein